MAMAIKRKPVTPFSICWKYSKPRLILSAPFTALCISHAITTTGMLAESPKTKGTMAPTLQEMLRGIIMPK